MATSVPALVNPRLLNWAREQAGFSLSDAADRLDLPPERLEAWERGEERPSMAKARKLADLYHRPLPVFYLAEPPAGVDIRREFRRLPGEFSRVESSKLLWILRQARYRREVALELTTLRGEVPAPFNHSTRLSEDPELLGERIRAILGISLEAQRLFTSGHSALNAWRQSIESQGVLVFQASRIALAEMRGLCIPETPMPVIVLNSKDLPEARIFSLLHEFVHLLLGQSGIYGTDAGRHQPNIEAFANRAAAATLVPKETILADPEVRAGEGEANWPEDALARLARRFRVTKRAMLLRLVTLQLASEDLYRARCSFWDEQARNAVEKDRDGGVPTPILVLSQVGRPFARLVIDSYRQGAITLRDASEYLGAAPKWMEQVGRELDGLRAPSAPQ